MKKVYLIDHYDSFSFNLLNWMADATPDCELVRVAYDDEDLMSKILFSNSPLIISPGPNHPKDVEPTLKLISKKIGKVPIFGVCLGMQILAYLNNGKIVKSIAPFHGSKRKVVFERSDGFFAGLEGDFYFASYNSLCVEIASKYATSIAKNENNELEAIEFLHYEQPAIGVQFHPESFLSSNKKDLQEAWKSVVDRYYSQLNS